MPGSQRLTNIAICVPARNEAASLPTLLAAISQLDCDSSWRVTVCLLLDGCTDGSADIARACGVGRFGPILIREVASDDANAGAARRAGMNLGLSALDDGKGLLLTTDADSSPTRSWVGATVRALDQADVVAGRIVRHVTHPSPTQDRLERYYDALFALRRQLDPVPWEASRTHHCAGGANLGIRAGVYLALGGFAPLVHGEDARLLDDASRAGWRVRRDADSVVHTSDRRFGRARGGLALTLREFDRHGQGEIDLVHPVDAAWQYRLQAAARAAFAAAEPERIAELLALSADHVRGVMRDCPNGEAFAMRVVPTPPGGMRRVNLEEAEAALASLCRESEAA